MLPYAFSDNLSSDNCKILRKKINGIEAAIEKRIDDQNRHNSFYYDILPSIHEGKNYSDEILTETTTK